MYSFRKEQVFSNDFIVLKKLSPKAELIDFHRKKSGEKFLNFLIQVSGRHRADSSVDDFSVFYKNQRRN